MQAQKPEMDPGRAVEDLERDFALSAGDLAHALAVDPGTLEQWRDGTAHPQPAARQRLIGLLGLRERLYDTFKTPDVARSWLHHPNRYLHGLTPADAIRGGYPDRVEGALEIIDSGIFL